MNKGWKVSLVAVMFCGNPSYAINCLSFCYICYSGHSKLDLVVSSLFGHSQVVECKSVNRLNFGHGLSAPITYLS